MLVGLLVSMTMNVYLFNGYIVERTIMPRYDYTGIITSEYHNNNINVYILNDIPKEYDING